MVEKRKRGRPLGSGVKNYCTLGCRFTEEEYLLIQESLKRLRGKYKTNSGQAPFFSRKPHIEK
ncbi:MAG: hypothetical protein KBE73_06115 [Fusobacteriaceae bacterium]|nr:hypothetical protein [Fusobacteriaceae bacterium]